MEQSSNVYQLTERDKENGARRAFEEITAEF